jgi:hypothetical protein
LKNTELRLYGLDLCREKYIMLSLLEAALASIPDEEKGSGPFAQEEGNRMACLCLLRLLVVGSLRPGF